MIIEPKNDGVVVKYLGDYALEGLAQRVATSGLLLPEPGFVLDDPVRERDRQDDAWPVLIGEIKALGPGKRLENGTRIKPEGLETGSKVLFQVNHTYIAYSDPDTNEILYLIGMGNIIALIESES
jgi:co-chaperonin GroES (HSP10)